MLTFLLSSSVPYKDSIDLSSGGVREADWPGCVSAKQHDDVVIYDTWKDQFKDWTGVKLVAVTGRYRSYTFRPAWGAKVPVPFEANTIRA